jgi:hypothetical protein
VTHPDIWTLWFSLIVAVLAVPMLIQWWLDAVFEDTWLSYRLLPLGFRYYADGWVWPQREFRLNSSLSYGTAPYKEWRVGPFGWRKYV